MVVFTSTEVYPWQKWIENRHNTYITVSGIYEVNWDYYASWDGDMRILAVKKEIARKLGVDD